MLVKEKYTYKINILLILNKDVFKKISINATLIL